MTKEQRHKCMAAIKGKDTKPEMVVRRYLHACGFRYRVNHPRLPGHPDVVLRRYRTVIMVNGCFWHDHEGCRNWRMPTSNVDYWRNKIEQNKERDHRQLKQLAAMGWHCITVWECELRPTVREQTLQSLVYTLNHIWLTDNQVRYGNEDSDEPMAAEEGTPYK